MAAVPVASIVLRTKLRTILRRAFLFIESSFELPSACQFETGFAATVIARPTVQAAKQG
jgi:hypothetical protein